MRRFEAIHSGRFIFGKDIVKALSVSRSLATAASLFKMYLDVIPGKVVFVPDSAYLRITAVNASVPISMMRQGASVGSLSISNVSLLHDCAVCDYTLDGPVSNSTVFYSAGTSSHCTVAGNSVATALSLSISTTQLTDGVTAQLCGIHGYANEGAAEAATLTASSVTITTEQPLKAAGLTLSVVAGGGSVSLSTINGRKLTVTRSGVTVSGLHTIQVTGTTIYDVAYSRKFHVRAAATGNTYLNTPPEVCPMPERVLFVRGAHVTYGSFVYVSVTSMLASAAVSVRVTTDEGSTITTGSATPLVDDPFVLKFAVTAERGNVEVKITSLSPLPGQPTPGAVGMDTWLAAIPVSSPPKRDVPDVVNTTLPDLFCTNAMVTTPGASGHICIPRFVRATTHPDTSWVETVYRSYALGSGTGTYKVFLSDGSIVTQSVPVTTYPVSSYNMLTVPASDNFIWHAATVGVSPFVTSYRTGVAPDASLIPPALLYYPDEA